jgi:hypothetical protein
VIDYESKTKKPNKKLAIISPILTFVVLAGIAWFLVWYWNGAGPSVASLTDDARKALGDSSPAPVGPRPRGPIGLTVPPLQVAGKGFIRTLYRDNRGAAWGVATKSYQLTVAQPLNTTTFQFGYSIRRESAFPKDGPENALFELAWNLVTSPLDRQHSGVSADVLQQLNNQFDGGQDLMMFPMKVPDADAKAVEALWAQYASSTAATHTAVGGNLLDALNDTCTKAIPENSADFAASLGKLRSIITVDKEASYRQGIQSAKAPPPPMRIAPPPAPAPMQSPATTPATQP